MPDLVLSKVLLAELAAHAESVGLLRLGAVDLAHPGFLAAGLALERFLDAGKAGDMDFLPRTRAVRQDPAQMLPGARSALIAAVPYTGDPGPVARYARGLDYHTVVHQRLISVERRLHALLPGVASLICVDTKPLLERSAAALAGLGFLGKHGCLIVPGLGSYVLLGAILCTAIHPEIAAPTDRLALGRLRQLHALPRRLPDRRLRRPRRPRPAPLHQLPDHRAPRPRARRPRRAHG